MQPSKSHQVLPTSKDHSINSSPFGKNRYSQYQPVQGSLDKKKGSLSKEFKNPYLNLGRSGASTTKFNSQTSKKRELSKTEIKVADPLKEPTPPDTPKSDEDSPPRDEN